MSLHITKMVHSIRHKEYRRAVQTHYWQTWIHQACYSPRHRRDCRAGTTILYHLHKHRQTHSLSVMTTGLTELLEHGHRRRYRRSRRTFQGLQARWSSGRTEPEQDLLALPQTRPRGPPTDKPPLPGRPPGPSRAPLPCCPVQWCNQTPADLVRNTGTRYP